MPELEVKEKMSWEELVALPKKLLKVAVGHHKDTLAADNLDIEVVGSYEVLDDEYDEFVLKIPESSHIVYEKTWGVYKCAYYCPESRLMLIYSRGDAHIPSRARLYKLL